ncbi:MAG: DUF4212 domain-containing protein [Hydrogenophaga sp.]
MTPPSRDESSARRYWRRTQWLTGVLLLVWWCVSFVLTYFARDLDFDFLGWPFSFWMAAQGSLVVYGLIIGGYAWVMDRLDRAHGVQEPGA